jgi:hypothetical protein
MTSRRRTTSTNEIVFKLECFLGPTRLNCDRSGTIKVAGTDAAANVELVRGGGGWGQVGSAIMPANATCTLAEIVARFYFWRATIVGFSF